MSCGRCGKGGGCPEPNCKSCEVDCLCPKPYLEGQPISYDQVSSRPYHQGPTLVAAVAGSGTFAPPTPGPTHYKQGTIEPLEFLEANPQLGLHEFNAIKYIVRWRQKDGERDLEKAIWYLSRLLWIHRGKKGPFVPAVEVK